MITGIQKAPAESERQGAGQLQGHNRCKGLVLKVLGIVIRIFVNSGAIIEHDCVIGDFSHVAPGSVLAGNVTVGDMTLIGAGAAVIPGVSIGSRCTVGAGAVVIRDIHNDHKALGVPALATAIRQGT